MSLDKYAPVSLFEWLVVLGGLSILALCVVGSISDFSHQEQKKREHSANCLWAAENSFEAYKRFCK